MSLALRRESEECLEENSLGDYHVRISKDLNLSVVGECGQPLFTISGIQFTRRDPNTKDIAYAVSLLKEFCSSHKDKIGLVLSTKKALANAIRPSSKKVNIHTFTHPLGNNIDLVFTEKTGLFTFGTRGLSVNTPVDIVKLKMLTNKEHIKLYSSEIAKAVIYKDLLSNFTKAKEDLNSCDI